MVFGSRLRGGASKCGRYVDLYLISGWGWENGKGSGVGESRVLGCVGGGGG